MTGLVVNEAPFQRQVIDLGHLFRWRISHFRPARTDRGWRTAVEADGAGFPDLVMVRPPELLIVELKSDKGKLSPDQRDWIGELTLVEEAIAAALGIPLAGQRLFEVHVWRPADFDVIHRRLSAPRPPALEAAA